MRKPGLGSSDSLELKMTPMIDVVFLLLIFFVWTSSFELPEFDLPSAIAEPPAGGTELSSETPPPEAFDEIVIRIMMPDAEVRLEFNGQPVDNIDALKARFRQVVSLGIQPPVIVDPSDEITINMAVEVYDAARSAGVDRVLFAAQP